MKARYKTSDNDINYKGSNSNSTFIRNTVDISNEHKVGDDVIPSLRPENADIVICALAIIICGIIRALTINSEIVAGQNVIIPFAYIGALFQWLISIRRRFIQKDMRRYLIIAVFLMILLLAERFVKYEYAETESTFCRLLWYAYYVSFTMIPVLLFLTSLHVGKTNQDVIDRRWKLIIVPAIVVIVGIMTNDIHQLAFRFNPGMVNWPTEYSRGILYYLSVIISGIALTGIVVVVFKNGLKKNVAKHMWLPIVVALVGILYAFSYTSTLDQTSKGLLQRMYEFPEFACFFFMAFFESLIIMRLIPSNSGHETFFMVSSLRAGLTDNDYKICLKSEEWNTPSVAAIKRAERRPMYLDDDKAILRCQSVSGGHFYWMEDVAELIKVNEYLSETCDYLEEEQVMLNETVKLEESRKSTAEQNRLYDMVSKRLQPQLDNMAVILDHLSADEETFKEQMRYVGILGAYIKRRSNLLLLSGVNDTIDSGELALSVEELLSYVSLSKISCLADIDRNIMLDNEYALALFELLEKIIENAMPEMTALMMTFKANNRTKTVYIEVAQPSQLFNKDEFEEHIASFGGDLSVEYEDNCEFVTWVIYD